MDVFLDSHKFSKNEEGSFIHTRNLGQREGHTYPEAKWSDVTIHGVNIDDSMFWHFRNDCLENVPSGKGGGEIIVTGTPEKVIKTKKSHTGRFLKDTFKRDGFSLRRNRSSTS